MQGHRSMDLPVQTFEFTRGFCGKEENPDTEGFCKFPVKTKAAGLLQACRQDFEAVRAG
jgi:hypothetical protein